MAISVKGRSGLKGVVGIGIFAASALTVPGAVAGAGVSVAGGLRNQRHADVDGR